MVEYSLKKNTDTNNIYAISVCIPVYYKENIRNLKLSFDSIVNQTYQAKEIVFVVDDPSSEAVNRVLNKYKEEYVDIVKIIKVKRGAGLGKVLHEGIKACSCPYIARMDADDIALPERFAKEIDCFKEDEEVSVVGSNIAEFVSNPSNIIGYRKVPVDDNNCKSFLKTRDPFNHMTVMMKREDVLRAGNYSPAMNSCEDTCLWVDMYAAGCKFKNIDQVLVYARAGTDMYARRGGAKAYHFVKIVSKHKYDVGLTNVFEYKKNLVVNYIVLMLMPNTLRGFIYERCLRRHK